MTTNSPAFSYDQIVRYMGKLKARARIDNPGTEVVFCTAPANKPQRGNLPLVCHEGQSGVIQAHIPGRATQDLHKFKLAYDETLDKSWWQPTDSETYSQMQYCGFEPR